MNFLAHFHLAWPDAGLIAGGLEGDFLKGPLRGDLPREIENGVALHRAIDAYTDDHTVIRKLRSNFPPDLRRYAGILIDLSFDHCLSQHWSSFSGLPLEDFNRQVYRALQENEGSFSEGARQMLSRLLEYDILNLYRNWETIPATAERIGHRFKQRNPLAGINEPLHLLKDQLEESFLAFYPQLQSFSAERSEFLRTS